jgi:hypothetical protein
MGAAGTHERSAALGPADLLAMSPARLDALFAAGVATAPAGEIGGTIVLAPGTRLATPIARLLGLAWRGKAFDHTAGELLNRIGPGDRRTGRARFAVARSRIDGRDAVVLDYSGSSSPMLAAVRDEMREVAPGLYLGVSFWRGRRIGRFALHPPG